MPGHLPVTTSGTAVDDLVLLLPDWRTHLRARNVASTTIASYLTVGDNLLVYLRQAGMPTAAGAITRDHLEAFLADLVDRLAAATVAKHYRSLQQLFRWLAEDGEITTSPMAKMRPPKVPEYPVEILTDDELSRLLACCRGQSFENRRDTALLRLLLDPGMRASELIGHASDLHSARRGVQVDVVRSSSLRVRMWLLPGHTGPDEAGEPDGSLPCSVRKAGVLAGLSRLDDGRLGAADPDHGVHWAQGLTRLDSDDERLGELRRALLLVAGSPCRSETGRSGGGGRGGCLGGKADRYVGPSHDSGPLSCLTRRRLA